VKRLLALIVGAFGLRAFLRHRRQRNEPADELREKLAAQRSTTAEPAPAPPPEPVAEPAAAAEPEPEPETQPAAEPSGDDVDARRADVHARARQKIDELSS
jgi:flagellar biosynthesis/type III secretory pathway M-ring protein FliF/YscJ